MKTSNCKERAGRYVVPIKSFQLTEQDTKWLHKICEIDYYGNKAHHFLMDVMNLEKQLWRFEGENLEGLGITSVAKYPKGSELWIHGIAGRGYVKQFPQILDALLAQLVSHDICWISGLATLPRLEKIYKAAGAKIKGSLFMLNLKEETHD